MVDVRTLIPRSTRQLAANRNEMLDPFASFRREVDRLFDEFFGGRSVWGVPFPTAGAGELLPEVDIVETDDAYKVVAELPGVDPDDVSIELRGDMLTIRGEKKAEREEKEENRYLVERRFGRFERTIRLPAEIEPDKAEASFDKGVLTIRLPKPEAAQKPVKRIEVKAA